MKVSEALHSRYTCRQFNPDPLERDTLIAILEDANRAPSWANTQPWEIFVAGGDRLEELRQAYLENFRKGVPASSDVPRPEKWPEVIDERMRALYAARFEFLAIDREDKDARQKMVENNYRFFGAPVVLYLCMDQSLTSWSMHDLGMMAQSIMLAAQERGIDSAIAYNLVIYPDLIRKTIDIPEDLKIVIGIALGYGNSSAIQNRFRSERRSLDEAVRFRGI